MGLDDELREIGDKIEGILDEISEWAGKGEHWAGAGEDLAKAVAAALASFGLPQAAGIAVAVAGALAMIETTCGKLKGARKMEAAVDAARSTAAHMGLDVPEAGKMRDLLEVGLAAAKALRR